MLSGGNVIHYMGFRQILKWCDITFTYQNPWVKRKATKYFSVSVLFFQLPQQLKRSPYKNNV
jgi:hypothetical protein